MPSLMVLALISIGLVAALLLLVRRRQAEESAPRPVRRPGDPSDLVSALVVELAVTPEAVKSRRRQLPPTAAPPTITPGEPPTPATPAAAPPTLPSPSVTPVDDGSATTPGVWARRRSPYASGAMGGQRISLPDDDSDFDISWRPYEQPAATTPAMPSPLARATQVSADGRIQVGHDHDDDPVSWSTRPS